MWLIARRSFGSGWGRLLTTLLAALLSVGLIAGTLQFAFRAQAAVSGTDASEYAVTDVLVQGGSVDPDDPHALPDGRVRLDQVAGRAGVAAVAGDAMVQVTVAGAGGRLVLPPAGSRTLLRPWVADERLRPYKLESGRAPAADGEIAIMRHVADAGGLRAGSTVSVGLPHRARTMRVVGIVSVQGGPAVAAGDLLLAPPETVRRAAGLPAGSWHAVWVKAAPSVPAARLASSLRRELGTGAATVRTAEAVRGAQSSNLLAEGASVSGGIGMLTTVAVFVGLFVVANTFGGLLRRRTRMIALLGAVGATPEQVKRLIRLEALAVGILASTGGVLLGRPIADALAGLFAADGFDITVAAASTSPLAVLASFAAGIGVTQAAAWQAARRASDITPMQALRETTGEPPDRRGLRIAAAVTIFASSFLFYGPVPAVLNDSPPGPQRTLAVSALIVIGSMIAVCALATLGPLLAGPLGGLIGRLGTVLSGEPGRLARATITRSPRRVSSAASSVMLGVALVTATAMIVISANTRFQEAGAEVMRAEHAISTTGKTPEGLRPLPSDITPRIAATPGVTHAVALTTTTAKLVSPAPRPYAPDEPAGPLYIEITGADQATLPAVLNLGGNLGRLADGEIGLPSTLMKAQRLRPGQKITLRGSHGEVQVRIAGAYHDPSHLFADGALVNPTTMSRLNRTAPTQAVLVNGATKTALATAAKATPGAEIMDRGTFVRHASAATTEGMNVIYGFILMTLLLALVGTATTISMNVTERRKEFALLRAVGATPRQLRTLVRWETATVITMGTALGLAIAIGTVTLIHTATASSYIRPQAPWWLYALVITATATITLITSALPARQAATTPLLNATKAE